MKNLLNEIKAMNKIAGTQLTKEQEMVLIRERLSELSQIKEAIMKDPKRVKVGDIAVTKRGKKAKVIAIGTIQNDWNDMKKFAKNSDIPKLISDTPEGAKRLLGAIEIVAVKYDNGRTEVWTYDPDNAYVPK